MTLDPLADFDSEILHFLHQTGIDPSLVQLSTPPEREFGDRGTNVAFLLAGQRRQAPKHIAAEVAAHFRSEDYRFLARVEPAGSGFINFYLNYEVFVPHVVTTVREVSTLFGRRADTTLQHVIVEHTSVNPNKEWHIGHVRNAVLGDIVVRLLRLAGHDVEVQNYIDDTGLQAAQAVVGLRDFPEQPRDGEKFDHYAGRLYVKIAAELAAETDLKQRLLETETRVAAPEDLEVSKQGERESILARLENIERLKGNIIHTMRVIEQGEYGPMIQAILNAQLQTAARLGIFYDLLAWESHLVESHMFQGAMERLRESPRVYLARDGRYAGALVIQTGEATNGEEPKCDVLVRSNGIPTYVAKDIAYHLWKLRLVPDRLRYVEYASQSNGETLWSTALHGKERVSGSLDRIVNVIAVNQSQAQDTVREALRVAGFSEAAATLFHLAYGLVSTREGKISGRKGTSVAADAIIDQAVQVAFDRVQEKRSQDLSVEEMQTIAESVGIGALRYLMVVYNPLKDIVFDVSDVVSFDGNTGLYVQYALVRMSAILRRAQTEHGIDARAINGADASLLQHEQERRLIYHIARYPGTVADVSRTLAVNLIAEFAFDLATIFNQFYRDCGVLNAGPGLREARLLLVQTVRTVLQNVCGVLGVPVIERL